MSEADDLARELGEVASKSPTGSFTHAVCQAGVDAAKSPFRKGVLAIVVSMVIALARALDWIFINLTSIEDKEKTAREVAEEMVSGEPLENKLDHPKDTQ